MGGGEKGGKEGEREGERERETWRNKNSDYTGFFFSGYAGQKDSDFPNPSALYILKRGLYTCEKKPVSESYRAEGLGPCNIFLR